ncbi:MAG: hypothetical protein H0X38_08690 [Planctomycetes bacterium]|nr:hypothetical protein [Planctomycetota bacterium]
MHLRHLVITSLAAISLGGIGAGAYGADTPPDAGGASMSIETSDKPLEVVLQWISRRAGVNLVCNAPDQPRVTLRLVNVTWQEAVQQIAARYDLVIEKHSERVWELTRPPKVRMEFQDARLTVVLEALARQANVNIVISDDIDANRRLTMTLNGVPWREALDVIVRATGYAWVEQEYQIIRVVSKDKLQKDLHTQIFHLNYSNAKELSTEVQSSLSADGKVVVDARSNSLILTDTPPALEAAARIIQVLDGRTREVQIEMKFVEFSNSDAQRLGFDPINMSFNVKDIGNLATSFTPFNDVFGGGVNYTNHQGGTTPNVPTANGQLTADFAFEAISTLGSTEILQAPQVLTLDNTAAKIRIGQEIHYAETTVTQDTNGNPIITLKEASSSPVKDGITITVTPHITTDGFISIELAALNEKATLVTFTNGKATTAGDFAAIKLPTKDSTELSTVIMVADGKTGVIGGILQNKSVEENRQIPLLGSIPGLGWLFKKRTESVDQKNLTIFITPRIIPLTDKSDMDEPRRRLRERISGLDLKPVAAPSEQKNGLTPEP